MHGRFLIVTFLIALISVAFSQSSLGKCEDVCRRLRGNCQANLSGLARTRCFDSKKNIERTCNCQLNFSQLQALSGNDVVQDCVIPQPLEDVNAATIKAKLVNVHINSISAGATLNHQGDIVQSTICKWTCKGRNRFQNCRMVGNVLDSVIGDMIANDEAALLIGGNQFIGNKVARFDADKEIQIASKIFSDNIIDTVITRISGSFSSVAGNEIQGNRFNRFIVGRISSFANLSQNTAGLVIVEGPCSVINRKSPIVVDGFFGVPNDRNCLKMFKRA